MFLVFFPYLKIVILSGASQLLGTRSRRIPRIFTLQLQLNPFRPICLLCWGGKGTSLKRYGQYR